MLDELKRLDYNGGKEGLLFFICDALGDHEIKVHDAEIICAHAPGKRYLSVKDLLGYCRAFGWIKTSGNIISLSPTIAAVINDKAKLNDTLVSSTVDSLFDADAFEPKMFTFDTVRGRYAFKNELFPLSLACVRNVLISQGFMAVKHDQQGIHFYISPIYDEIIAKHCKEKRKQISLAQLKKRLEIDELAGEKAELFVMSYERKRLGSPLCDKVKRISEIDVAAGYDIISFDSCHSREVDRFIEVKATSNTGFYWSKNEYEMAKLKGAAYYLYLVDLSKVDIEGYEPKIIKDPAVNVMEKDEWLVEAQTYYIRSV